MQQLAQNEVTVSYDLFGKKGVTKVDRNKKIHELWRLLIGPDRNEINVIMECNERVFQTYSNDSVSSILGDENHLTVIARHPRCKRVTFEFLKGRIKNDNFSSLETALITKEHAPFCGNKKDIKAEIIKHYCNSFSEKEINDILNQIDEESQCIVFFGCGRGTRRGTITDGPIILNCDKSGVNLTSPINQSQNHSDYLLNKLDHDGFYCKNNGFIYSGVNEDAFYYKIPWDDNWGDTLPQPHEIEKFDKLYDKLIKQQQSQTANIINKQTIQNQIIRNNAITQGDKMIAIGFGYNDKLNRFQIDPNKTIRELMNQIFNMARNNDVEVKYEGQKLNMNSGETLASAFGDKKEVFLTVNDKQNVVQTTLNQNISTNNALLRSGFNNGLSSSGAAMVNKQPVQALRPTVKTVRVTVPVQPQPPVVSPPPVVSGPVTTRPPFVPPRVVNNNPFGDRTTGYIPGLRIFQRRPALRPPRPLFVPPPKFVPRPAPRPVQTFRPPTVVPVPRLMTVPPRPLVVPPVVPVPQSGDGRPEPDTYYVLQGYTKNMNTQVTNWSPQPTQRIPMDYQTFINQNIHGAQYLQPQWSPKYQYCDELGMIFESDSPIYKDAKNNLVTLGNARYRTP